ncbi:ATP-binding protein [Microbacterium sp. OVT16B]|uniref:ATP-binding protein n=1 Tax=Microbacterium sp. OVT16B TaxID=2862682 RepID=UPI001CBF6A36|nr:ATP-binding protein [Microbacterium sp. OVT16B]
MADTTELIDGSPTKRFFIEILTRDISITAAILDLVDNSIDSARMMCPDGALGGLRVSITANSSEFSIEDNCAGIGAANARDYVFRIGRPDDIAPSPESIGQFGVGMKRALFKIGASFAVESTSSADSFTVDVDTQAWMRDESSWTLPMTVHEPSLGSTGTTIIVDRLYPQVAEAFSSESFLSQLAEELRSRHRLAMGNGLTITLNENELKSADSMVAMSDLLRPAVSSFTIPTPNAGDLSVRIVVGVAPTGLHGIDEDAEPEEQSSPAADAGWLVFGNGRLLLANDKSRLTGWGSGRAKIPQYHNQYARFRGFVYMTAHNAGAIPWNTMKTTVDPDSPVWSQVLTHMITTARGVIDLLNQAKAERRLATDDMATPTLDAIRSASPVDAGTYIDVQFSMSMEDLREGISVSAIFPAADPELAEAWKKIQYTVLMQTFDELASALGLSNAAEIGRLSFDAFHAANTES